MWDRNPPTMFEKSKWPFKRFGLKINAWVRNKWSPVTKRPHKNAFKLSPTVDHSPHQKKAPTSNGFPTSNWKHSACHCRCTVPILFLMGECDPCRGKANNLRGIREVIPRNESFTHPTSILCSLHPRHCSRAVNMTRKEPDGVLYSVGRQETNKQTDDTVSGSKKYTKENQNRSLWRKVIGQRVFLSAKEGFSEEVSLELRSKQWDLG